MHMRWILWLIMGLWPILLLAQPASPADDAYQVYQFGDSLRQADDLAKQTEIAAALVRYDRIMQQARAKQAWPSFLYACMQGAKINLGFTGSFEQAYQRYLSPAKAVLAREPAQDPTLLVPIEQLMGVYWRETGRLQQAREQLIRMEALLQQYTPAMQQTGQIYLLNQWRYSCFEQGFLVYLHQESLPAAKRFLDSMAIYRQGPFDRDPAIDAYRTRIFQATYYTNLGLYHEMNRAWPEALTAYQQGLDQAIPFVQPTLWLNVGVIHYLKGDYPAAIAALQRSAALIQANNPAVADLGRHYLVLSWIYHAQGQADSARAYQQRLLAVESQRPDYYLRSGKIPPVSTLNVNERVIFALHNLAAWPLDSLGVGSICAVPEAQELVSAQPVLHRAAQNARQARALLDTLRLSSYLGDGNEIFAAQDTMARLMQRGVQLHAHLARLPGEDPTHHLGEALAYSESNKYSQLYAALRQRGMVENPYLDPDQTLKDREQILLRQMATAKQNRYAAYLQDQADLSAFDQQLDSLRRAQDSLLTSLAEAYPAYHRLRYGSSTPDLAKVQRTLGEQEAVLEFFTAPEAYYAFTLTRDTLTLRSICRSPALDSAVAQVAQQLAQRPQEPTDWEQVYARYVRPAQRLYQTFLQPTLQALDTTDSQRWRLQLICDGPLQGISWGATLTQLPPPSEQDNPAAWAYLALDPHLVLSYQYSLAVRSLQDLPLQQDYAYEYGGFAGTYREASLPLGQQALQNIGGLAWPGQTRIALGYQDWGQADFWQQARAYRILHLSVHGSLNWADPMQSALHFSAEDSLRTAAVYDFSLPIRLLILDACETSVGRTYPGEGAMSLATAFGCTGIQSSLTSLWKVDDAASGFLMKRFFTALLAGHRLDLAWQQAQQTYLRSGNYPAHPYYWAALIPSGNMAPVYESGDTDFTPAWAGWLLLVAAGGGAWWYRRRQLRRKAA